MILEELRRQYHERICTEIIRTQQRGAIIYPNFADVSSTGSVAIGARIVELMGCHFSDNRVSGQTAGKQFELITKVFLEDVFSCLQHLRPGQWIYSTQARISAFDQYEHLANIERIVSQDSDLVAALGSDYIITPDIVIGRYPVSDAEINRDESVIDPNSPLAAHTSFRAANRALEYPILHASISCKWTIRSDRSQNARSEALNLIRNRKGHVPHIAVVTAEPLPTRIASLALGTGDVDCVYHFALPELRDAVISTGNEDQLDMLNTLIDGRRLRDISDLPFDLAV